MVDKETIAVYDKQVEGYAEMVSDEAGEDAALINFIGRLSNNDLVLDLGCGPAQASAIMRDQGLRVDPVDASIEMVKLANKTYGIGARQATFSDIQERDVYAGVWANFSLLHASVEEFPSVLIAIRQALKTDGVFHIGMKLGEGAARDSIGRLYSYYSKDELCHSLSNSGFRVDEVVQGEALGMAGTVDPWITVLSLAE